MFRVHGHEQHEIVHCHLQADMSDLPAGCKVSGLAGHTSKYFMCPFCEMPFYRLVDPSCYDPTSESQASPDVHVHCADIIILAFKLRDDWRYIKYAYRARDADPNVTEEIFVRRGIQWFPLTLLPGWLPSSSSLIDFMHCIFLCTRLIFILLLWCLLTSNIYRHHQTSHKSYPLQTGNAQCLTKRDPQSSNTT
jgi:hypothetical protein